MILFSTWIKDRINKYGFVENEDFIILKTSQSPILFDSPNLANHHLVNGTQLQNPKLGGDRKSLDYILTLDTAKEFSMLENNDKGRRVRKYFIDFGLDII
ncbi:hypothetical protein BKH41_08570 [Helicobacter sp. 12S02232-10]|uniref:antA/AntB antirepressor family protein n=1 Tax=Helicobacter sp. 12S02232-10 TaxID=1476197 RepID=UPI000BA63FE2|nr:antA/AntB antirepressor family protein [Helicobacter sp. 12S02232-10]PAF46753.1 hypothetical protein BKH41_08570 [Helicobacter sp. 12S02232-10]